MVDGEIACVPVIAAEDFTYSVAPEENPQRMLSTRGPVFAPVAEGEDAGYVYVLIEGKAVGKVPVVYGQTSEQKQEAPRRPFWRFWEGKK